MMSRPDTNKRIITFFLYHNICKSPFITINSYDLIHFIRDFQVIKAEKDTYINISRNQAVNKKVKKLTGLTTLDAGKREKLVLACEKKILHN